MITVAECKGAWKSLRDGRRYRIKKRKSSGSAADLEFEEVADNLDWEYEECLRFLIPTQTMRKYVNLFVWPFVCSILGHCLAAAAP